MAVIKRRKKKPTLTKGTTVFVKPERGLSALEVGKFRNELQKQKSKAIASVNRKYNPVNPSSGGATESARGIPVTKKLDTKISFNIRKPRIIAKVRPLSTFRVKYRVGRVKLLKRIGEY